MGVTHHLTITQWGRHSSTLCMCVVNDCSTESTQEISTVNCQPRHGQPVLCQSTGATMPPLACLGLLLTFSGAVIALLFSSLSCRCLTAILLLVLCNEQDLEYIVIQRRYFHHSAKVTHQEVFSSSAVLPSYGSPSPFPSLSPSLSLQTQSLSVVAQRLRPLLVVLSHFLHPALCDFAFLVVALN